MEVELMNMNKEEVLFSSENENENWIILMHINFIKIEIK